LQALGLLDTQDPEQMNKNMAARKDSTPEAAEQRLALTQAIDSTHYVYNAHGVEMNMRYTSNAVVPDGSPDPGFKRDAELYHEHSSRPGAPIPHAWLQRGKDKVSTLDLCGRGKFSLITGTGGEAWAESAREVSSALGIQIDAHVIGPGKEVEDPYGDFTRLREIDENGALLVRPDFIVAWRSEQLQADTSGALTAALGEVLGRT